MFCVCELKETELPYPDWQILSLWQNRRKYSWQISKLQQGKGP